MQKKKIKLEKLEVENDAAGTYRADVTEAVVAADVTEADVAADVTEADVAADGVVGDTDETDLILSRGTPYPR